MIKKRLLPESSMKLGFISWRVQKPFTGFTARLYERLRQVRRVVIMIMMVGIAHAQSWDSIDKGVHLASSLARGMLTAHNAVRAEVKLPPLQWSDELVAVSQKWADTLLVQSRFAHNPDSPYGENLFMITGATAAPSIVVREWASESRDYDYRLNTCRAICGHYTQIVWRHTLRVGCAVARGAGREVWVCSYDPPGNFVGERPY